MWKPPTERRSLQAQQGNLNKMFPESKCRVRREILCWRGIIRPTALSDDYTLQVKYMIGHCPEPRVISPALQQRGARECPHRYSDGSLCLFHPERYEFTASKFLSETIIPWASEWLFFYEIWLATGEWLGGGEHPPQKRRSPNRQGEARGVRPS